MVADDQGLAGLLRRVKLDEAAGATLAGRGEPLDAGGRGGAAVREDVLEVGVLHLGHVEEMQELGGGKDAVLSGALGIVEPVVAVLLKVHEGEGPVGQGVRVLDLGHVVLLGPVQTDLEAKHGRVADVVDAVLDPVGVCHLHHDTALLGLEKHHLADVAVLTEQVENALTIEFVRLNSVDHGHGAAALAHAAAGTGAAVDISAAATLANIAVTHAGIQVHGVHAVHVHAIHCSHQCVCHPIEVAHCSAHASVHAAHHPSHVGHATHASPHATHSSSHAAHGGQAHAATSAHTSHAHAAATATGGHAVHLWRFAEQDRSVHLHGGGSAACKLVGVIPGHLVVLLDLEPVCLCVLHLEGAAAGVDVAAVEVALGGVGALHRLKLHHGVDDVAASEDNDTVDLADVGGDLVDDGDVYRIVGVEDCEEQDLVGPGVGIELVELLLDLVLAQGGPAAIAGRAVHAPALRGRASALIT